jgi:hypothetical protein
MLRGILVGVVTKLQPVSLHGQLFYDVHYVRADDEELLPQMARVGAEDVQSGIHPGDRVKLHILLNQVTKVERDG